MCATRFYLTKVVVPMAACKFGDGGNWWVGLLVGSNSIQILPYGSDSAKFRYDIEDRKVFWNRE